MSVTNSDIAELLQEKGFEVIGCPAIIGAGNKIYPPESRYTNIERYAEMAVHSLRLDLR